MTIPTVLILMLCAFAIGETIGNQGAMNSICHQESKR
jgi:hypothetical protein